MKEAKSRCMYCGTKNKHRHGCKAHREKLDMNNNILITHDDLDGAGCSVVFNMMVGGKVFYENYTSIDDRIISAIAMKPKQLFIADISPTNYDSLNAINNAIRTGMNIIVTDHHKTAIDRLSGFSWAKCDINGCGTKLLYKYLCGVGYFNDDEDNDTELDEFVNMVDDYDRWIHKDPNSMKLNSLFRAYGMNAFVDRCLKQRYPSTFNATDSIIVDIFSVKEIEYADKVIESGEICDGFNGKALVVFAENCQSLIGERCRIKKIDCDFVAIVDLHHRKVSMRSVKKGFDVGKIAEANGGGGHIGSAGFEINYNTVISVVEGIL